MPANALIESSSSNELLFDPGSYRDPSGRVFESAGEIYRTVTDCAKANYELLMSSGLYDELVKNEMLVPHSETTVPGVSAYKVLAPQRIQFISYPHEWSFSQLKDAALLTLDIQLKALKYGLSLRDANAFNIQYQGAKAVLIDTLSFEAYPENKPWIAYRQFCEQFLAPLALMSRCDVRINELLRSFIDGVPLDMAKSLLGFSAWLSPRLAVHIMLHAGMQQKYADSATDKTNAPKSQVSKTALIGLIESLKNCVNSLNWKATGTEWGDYYNCTNYTDEAMRAKALLVEEFLNKTSAKNVWDLGANTGRFSAIAAKSAEFVLACDIDPAAVEKLYCAARHNNERKILPIRLDLANPTSGFGWAGSERKSLASRGPADCVMALALIHHLAIARNVPLPQTAQFFAQLCDYLIIEFVPKSDSQVKRLLATREDVFPNYTIDGFINAYEQNFKIVAQKKLGNSERTLFLMQRA